MDALLDTGHQSVTPIPDCWVHLRHEVAAGSFVTELDKCTPAMPSSGVDRKALRNISENCLISVSPVYLPPPGRRPDVPGRCWSISFVRESLVYVWTV